MLMFASVGLSCCSCVIHIRRTSSLASAWLIQIATMFPRKTKRKQKTSAFISETPIELIFVSFLNQDVIIK